MKLKLFSISAAIVLLLSIFSPLGTSPAGISQAAAQWEQGTAPSTQAGASALKSRLDSTTAKESEVAASSFYPAHPQEFFIDQHDLDRVTSDLAEIQELHDFIEAVKNEKRKGLIVGAFAPDAFAAPVTQQPADNLMYVSNNPEKVTQFRRASWIGSVGLLAHNYLMGQYFYNLDPGDKIFLVKWDGTYQEYRVYDIEDYRVLSPTAYQSVLTQKYIDQYSLLDHIYSGDNDKLVLQTCIEQNGNKSWGRRFILARLITGK